MAATAAAPGHLADRAWLGRLAWNPRSRGASLEIHAQLVGADIHFSYVSHDEHNLLTLSSRLGKARPLWYMKNEEPIACITKFFVPY